MGEEINAYFLDDLSFDVLQCYLKYGYGDMKVYDTSFFMCHSDEQACLTLKEFHDKVVQNRNSNISKGGK